MQDFKASGSEAATGRSSEPDIVHAAHVGLDMHKDSISAVLAPAGWEPPSHFGGDRQPAGGGREAGPEVRRGGGLVLLRAGSVRLHAAPPIHGPGVRLGSGCAVVDTEGSGELVKTGERHADGNPKSPFEPCAQPAERGPHIDEFIFRPHAAHSSSGANEAPTIPRHAVARVSRKPSSCSTMMLRRTSNVRRTCRWG